MVFLLRPVETVELQGGWLVNSGQKPPVVERSWSTAVSSLCLGLLPLFDSEEAADGSSCNCASMKLMNTGGVLKNLIQRPKHSFISSTGRYLDTNLELPSELNPLLKSHFFPPINLLELNI